MKLNFGRRFLLFIHWALSLALAGAFLASHINAVAAQWIEDMLAKIPQQNIVYIAAAAVYVIFSLATLTVVFGRGAKRSDRGYIVIDSSDSGRSRIAVAAIEQMCLQAMEAVGGITERKLSISNNDDAVSVDVNVSVVEGTHIPTVMMNVQQAIRQFVSVNCGVSVRSVAVNVQSVNDPNAPASKRGRKSADVPPPIQPVAPMPQPIVPEQPKETNNDDGISFLKPDDGEIKATEPFVPEEESEEQPAQNAEEY